MIRANLAIIITIVSIGILIANVNNAFAETIEWKSDIAAGILPTEPSEFDINLIVSTYSNNELKLEWNEPSVSNNQVVVGYKIMRKTIDTEYITLVEKIDATETYYIDGELSKNFYGYKIVPITERKKPESISMHGINRNHSMFDIYCKGQELLAKQILKEVFNGKTIENTSIKEPLTHYGKFIKRADDPILQNAIRNELIKAEQVFRLFNVQINH